MPLKLNLIVPNKAVHAFIGLVVVVALVVGVYAYTFPPSFLGHGGDQVWIDTTLGETDLQAAIDGGLLGADDDWEKVGGGEPTLTDDMYHTGRVGIATNDPKEGLHLHSSGSVSYMLITNSWIGDTQTDGLRIGTTSSGHGLIWLYENDPLRFATNNQDRLRIDNTGNVGIGDDMSPDAKLEIVKSASGDILNISSASGNDGDLMTILNDGRVGIGETNPSQKLDVSGNIIASGTVCDSTGCIGAGGGGDITDVQSGEGTKGGASSGPVTIEFDCSEVSGNGITCSGEDLQVNTGPTLTTGLEIVSDQVRLMNNGCVAGEVLKRNAANNGWECVADETGAGGGVEFGGMYAICCNGACTTPNPATGACSCPAGFSNSSIPFTIGLQGCGGPPCGTRGTIRFCSG